MSLQVRCAACGKNHKAPERAAGRTVACLGCGKPMKVPEAEAFDPGAFLLEQQEEKTPRAAPAAAEPETFAVADEPAAPPSPPRKKAKPVAVATLPPLTTNDPPAWRRHLHWLLVLALLPLTVSLLVRADDRPLVVRLAESLADLPEEQREEILAKIDEAESPDEVLALLPGHKLPGALLARPTAGHWFMAVAAAVLYLAFFMFLAADGVANPFHILFVGLCTATAGVGFLLLVQRLAAATSGHMIVGHPVVALIFLALKLIAFSYQAASDPDNGFFLSFFGFTLGVGLCEEVVKTFPLYWHRATATNLSWRSFLIWGLASGAGFGIAEGIMYSAQYYNGMAGPGIYLVRFVSCVALHAIWSGSVGIMMYLCDGLFEDVDRWYDWISPTLVVVGVPAVLHGLYDTCLKKEMNGAALLVAFASFGYLAFLFSRLQTGDDAQATKDMLREYRRRRAAMAAD